MDKRRLLNLIKRGEGTKVDYKQKIDLETESSRKELAKDICAIANSKGGRGYLIIGIEDKTKNIIGIEDKKYGEEQIQQIVSSRCEPPIPVSLEFIKFDNKELAIINIYDGPQKPYQMRENGAFYVRRGSTTDTMRKEEIISALQESLNLNLEICPIVKSDMNCINMDLVHKYFRLKGIETNDNNIISFAENASIITFDRESNRYMATLGGLLVFSDVNSLYVPHNMIRIINKVNKNFKENIIIQGNLISILDNCEDILKKILPKGYPVNGVFEGVRNAVLYRDYTLYYKEIEIVLNYNSIILVSPGVLMGGKDLNSSQYLKRNMWIYEKLITLDNKERFVNTGRGFFRMKRYFKGKGRLTFVNSIRDDSFKIIYPGINLFR